MNIRPVIVEFLREGPRHNQLLSPLTPYLAVCGDSPAGVVKMPYEHAVFERRRQELRYAVSSEADEARRRGILDQTGREMAEILSLVPGLPGVISSRVNSSEILHLRLVLSASELALLPFELAKIPTGGGAPPDNWLLLHANAPVCLTRRNRAVRPDNVKWPVRPRILFAYGEDVPYEQHLKELKEALAPWADGEELKNWLTVVAEPTLPQLNDAARSAPFTHVHILAHGAPYGDNAYGLSLKDSVATGQELATALFDVNDSIHRPTVVTLATCDSGAQGSVVNAPDVSVAHNLHEAGIPLVIASQFPLSVEGSGEFVKLFYSDQLKGTHPLQSIYAARLRLHTYNASRFHDWASLVVYEALPPDLDEQLFEVQYGQKSAALDRALTSLETAGRNPSWTTAQHECLESRVASARDGLPAAGPYTAECAGLKAASWKREAFVHFKLASRATEEQERVRHAASSYRNLRRALHAYLNSGRSFLEGVEGPVQRKATLHWLLGQAFSLQAALGEPVDPELWTVARFSAQMQLRLPAPAGEAWAHGTLAELKLLRLADRGLTAEDGRKWAEEALDHARELVAQNGPGTKPVVATSRQFARYVDWWSRPEFESMMARFGVPAKETWRRENGLIDTVLQALSIFEEQWNRTEDEAAEAQPDGGREAAVAAEVNAPPAVEEAAPASEAPGGEAAAPELLAARPATDGAAGSGVFRIEMLPARNGDCLWIEYGDPKRPNRVLIDCGAESAAKLLLEKVTKLEERRELDRFDLFVLTHIDSDHIAGVLPFFKNRGLLTFGEVWFNAEPQLPPAVLGVMQGEQFADILSKDPGLNAGWNRSAGRPKGKPAAIVVPDEGALPSYTLPGGMRLTVLSPGARQLKDLARVWRSELQKLKQGKSHEMLSAKPKPRPVRDLEEFDLSPLLEAKEKDDPSVANGSSIAVLAEFDGRAALLTGDAHAPVVASSVRRLLQARKGGERLKVDAMKLSHHGSTNALTKDLLSALDCHQYLISSDGSKFYHPDREAVARVIRFGGESPKLIFNYKSEMNSFWGDAGLMERYGYRTAYPADGESGFLVEL